MDQSRPDQTKQFLNRWWVILAEIALVIPFWAGAYLVTGKNLWVPLIGFSTTVLLVFVVAILGY